MPTTTIIDMLRTTAPNLRIIGDLDGIRRVLTFFEQRDGDATHIWADDDGHSLVLFRDADGNTMMDAYDKHRERYAKTLYLDKPEEDDDDGDE